MAIQIQLKRGNASQNDAYTGPKGELTFDTSNRTLRSHDGTTKGGTQYLGASEANTTLLKKTDSVLHTNTATNAGSASTASYGTMPSNITAVNVGQKTDVTYTVNNTATSTSFVIPYFTVDAQGRITSASQRTITLSHPVKNYSSYSSCSNYSYTSSTTVSTPYTICYNYTHCSNYSRCANVSNQCHNYSYCNNYKACSNDTNYCGNVCNNQCRTGDSYTYYQCSHTSACSDCNCSP